MSERTFDRETLLDLTVNIIPLGIILFFVVVFFLFNPWEQNLFIEMIAMGLLFVPLVLLALLTFVSGRAISQDEKRETDATAQDDSLDESEGIEDDSDDATTVIETVGTGNSGESGTDTTESAEDDDSGAT